MSKSTSSPESIIFRAKRSYRLGVLFAGTGFWLLWLGMQVLLFVTFRPIARDLKDILGEDLQRYGDLIGIGEIALFLFLTASMVFTVRYWWTYRIVLDEGGISREGIRHPLDRKIRMNYEDIERVARGSRHVLRVVPREGKVLVTNVKMLEGAQPGLIEELRRRLGTEVVPPQLESEISERRRRDRLDLAFVWVVLGLFALFMTSYLLRNRILALFAWKDVVPGTRRIVAFDVASDGAIWALSESKLERRRLGLKLTRLISGDRVATELPLSGLAREVAHPYDPVYNSLEGMVVDTQNRVWVLFEETDDLHYWDGEEWRRLGVKAEEGVLLPREIVRVGEEMWGITRGSSGVFRIRSATLERFDFLVQGTHPEDGSHVTLMPDQLSVGHDGSIVFSGRLSLGYPGVARFAADGAMIEFFGLDESVPLPDDTWRFAHAGTDREGNLYAFYWSEEGCEGSALSIIAGVHEFGSGEWTWGKLNRTVECADYWSWPSFAVDPKGRIWVQLKAPGGGGVMVYDREELAAGMAGSFHAIRYYTEQNSRFIGERLRVASNGRIFAMDEYGGEAVWIDASVGELPTPAPAILGYLWDRPYLIFIPYVGIGIVLSVVTVRRNWSREYVADN